VFTIRPFDGTDRDYGGIVAVRGTVWPNLPDTIEERRYHDEHRDARYLFERFVAEAEGRVVASCFVSEPVKTREAGLYFVAINVLPEWERRGIGSACYDHALARLALLRPAGLKSSTREDKPQGVRFLEKRGFRRVMREQMVRLDLSRFDAARFADRVEGVRAQGIEIVTLDALKESDPSWQRKLWDLDWSIHRDVPSPEPHARQSFESFLASLGAPGFLSDGYFVALDGDRYVGLTHLLRANADPHTLGAGLTGVVRGHRRRGIATALKVRACEYARNVGAKAIETGNEESNPMSLLNAALGFEPLPSWLVYKKDLDH
jgi:GNAT superfamily N-acetyltransferase